MQIWSVFDQIPSKTFLGTDTAILKLKWKSKGGMNWKQKQEKWYKLNK